MLIENEGFCFTLKPTLDNENLNTLEKLLYLSLISHCEKRTRTCYPSIKTLMKNTSISSETTLNKTLESLEAKGMIHISKFGDNNNVYRVCFKLLGVDKYNEYTMFDD